MSKAYIHGQIAGLRNAADAIGKYIELGKMIHPESLADLTAIRNGLSCAVSELEIMHDE